MKRQDKKNEHLKQQLKDLHKKFDELKLDSWEKVEAHDKHMADVYIELAKKIRPLKLPNQNNIAVLGSVSVGKSTIVNSLLDKKLADVGAGETTTRTSVYKGNGLQIFDVYGKNDEKTYMTPESICDLKSVEKRLLVITSTVKDITKLARFLDQLNLRYTIVFNKFDLVDDEEQQQLRQKIENEVKVLELKCCEKIYFISGKHPEKFDDWNKLVKHLRQ
ncbi:unnamed protein product [Rotaria sordida]|uniref:G domain-containing protein n=1 Tax=Rotaria sordida TaxID=392033 RepID=A0A814G370_9BILA|nr:unnamed protein product [Rotaria sordida]